MRRKWKWVETGELGQNSGEEDYQKGKSNETKQQLWLKLKSNFLPALSQHFCLGFKKSHGTSLTYQLNIPKPLCTVNLPCSSSSKPYAELSLTSFLCCIANKIYLTLKDSLCIKSRNLNIQKWSFVYYRFSSGLFQPCKCSKNFMSISKTQHYSSKILHTGLWTKQPTVGIHLRHSPNLESIQNEQYS